MFAGIYECAQYNILYVMCSKLYKLTIFCYTHLVFSYCLQKFSTYSASNYVCRNFICMIYVVYRLCYICYDSCLSDILGLLSDARPRKGISMTQTHAISPSSSTNSTVPKHYVNWHEAAVCAVQIELRDYADLLDFQPEFILGKNSYRIDLLVIKKLSQQAIPKISPVFSQATTCLRSKESIPP